MLDELKAGGVICCGMILQGVAMSAISINCSCGRVCHVNPSDGFTLRCAHCRRMVSLPSKDSDPARRDSLDGFIEAVFELLDGVDGAFPTSGAR